MFGTDLGRALHSNTRVPCALLQSVDDGMINWRAMVGVMGTGRGSTITRRNSRPKTSRSPQIPYHLAWDRTGVAVMGSRRLIARAMV
jgi:hypothetical protein